MPVRTSARPANHTDRRAAAATSRGFRALSPLPGVSGLSRLLATLLLAMSLVMSLVACAPRITDDGAQPYASPQPERIYPGPVPVQVLDRFLLTSFAQRHPDAAQRAGLVVLPDGRAEPSGDIVPQDYQPESYGLELALRLNLRSFPSLLLGFTDDTRRTFASPRQWTVSALDRTTLNVHSPDLMNTLVVFATLDWNANGVRDWLVLFTQKTPHDEGFYLGYWLVVEDPAPKGLLQARLLSLDEYRGIGQPVVRTGEEARVFLDKLLREQILPASQEAARQAADEATIKAILKKP
ncbi:hypothetical protein [Nitratidesulfovibrio sp.]|uniref:hypothetical protein n=1 Tax=Nitratidesulfovibrio sp. TaxID=2802297 RepID=UPI00334062DB